MTGPIVFDIETHSTNEMYAKPPEDFFRIGGAANLDGSQSVSTPDFNYFRQIVADAPVAIGHNIIAFDLPALGIHDLLERTKARRIIDTWTLATVLDPPPDSYQPRTGARRFPREPAEYKPYYALDNLAFQYGAPGKSHDLKQLAKERGDPNACCTFGSIPTEDVDYRTYLDADVQAGKTILGAMLAKFSPSGLSDYAWREMRVAAIMATVSRNGFRLDRELTERRIAANQEIRQRNTDMLVEKFGLPLTNAAGKEAKNPVATKDGKLAIFRALAAAGVEPTELAKTGKGQPSLSADSLHGVAEKHPGNPLLETLVDTVAGIQGLRTVYQTALDNVHVDGFAHPDIFALQASGRLSTQDPGLTVFGKRGGRHIERDVYLADNEDEVLMYADFSQIDARSVAALSQDHNYLDQFKPGVDLHIENARAAFGPQALAANAKLRDMAKVVGHGWNYNMGFTKLAGLTGVGEQRARAFMDMMERQYPRLIQWKQEMVDQASSTGRLDNGFGRIMKANRERAWTQGPALMGQGAARDLMFRAILRMDNVVVRMIKALVHDEVVFSVPIVDALAIRQHVTDCMTFQWCPPGASRPVDIIADASRFAYRWGDLYAA